MIGIPVNRQVKYLMDSEGNVALNTRLSGRCLEPLVGLLAPSPQDTQQALLRLRTTLKLSRQQLAAALGVSRGVLRRWETGERKPSLAARKLVRLIELILFSPSSIALEFGGTFIGRVDPAALLKLRLDSHNG